MTSAEKKQQASVFLDAGKHAYHINVPQNFNPYTEEPFRSLWDKGYKKAKLQHEESFVRAGRIAYASGLDLKENPHKVPNQRELWDRGLKLARAADERKAAIARGDYVPPVRKPFVKPQTKNLPKSFVTKSAKSYPPNLKDAKSYPVRIPNKGHRPGTIGDYVAGTVNGKGTR